MSEVGSSGGMKSDVTEANIRICGGWKGSVGCWKATSELSDDGCREPRGSWMAEAADDAGDEAW